MHIFRVMPYRRLPNTDKARINALSQAIKESGLQDMNSVPISFKLLQEAKTQCAVFQKCVQEYNQTFERQVAENKKYQQIIKNVRLYISHFIQVLNFAVLRGEIKKDKKEFYKLDPDDFTVPDLSTENALLEWGKNIINGENERTRMGGVPIYNPTIAKVRVHYDLFKDYKNSQKTYQHSTARNQDNVAQMRSKIDAIIVEIWNQVEKHFEDSPADTKLQQCKKYGIIYYYRKGEQLKNKDGRKSAEQGSLWE